MEVPLHPALQRRIAAVENEDRVVISTEPDGRIIYWNPEAERLYGWTAREPLGRNIVVVTPSELARTEAAEIMHVLSRGPNPGRASSS